MKEQVLLGDAGLTQYLVVVPVPEAKALTFRKKGRSARRVLVGSCMMRAVLNWIREILGMEPESIGL